MSREPNEGTFGAALANEFQWRNLYLKEFGCCTYPPPIPKDPSTTAVGVYPMRRQAKLLQQESSSSSEDADNEVEEDDHYEESTDDTDGDDSYQANFSSSLFQFSFSGGDSDGCHSRKHQSHNVDLADAELPSTSCSRRDRSTADQFFSLDLSMPVGEDGASTHTFRHPSYRSSGRRCGQGAVLRKDDFFDTNDVFSTKFFSFLWMESDNDGNDEEYASDTRTVDHEVRRWGARDPDNGRGMKSSMRSRKSPGRLTLSRPGFSTVTSHAFNTNPQGVPEAVLRLHHQTWILLMDNRLMAWVHRAATDHCQRATQLRQRLLEIIALGPCSADITGDATFASPTQVSTSLVLPEEDALQRTLESFSPFFVVVAPPPAVQRAKDQFRAAQRGQLRSGNGQQAAAASVADLIGLPLLSQYGSWREAYEHRHRWDKVPFSFFFIHDVSYNYAQVTALFVQLQLLYTHSHSHSRRCAEAKRESVPLKSASRQFTTLSTASRTPEERRHVCPLVLMQEMTENVLLAYEQSSARTALPMLRRVLDFLTDTALDVVTAHRFISRKAVLRQHQFQLPGMTTVRPLPLATRASAAVTAAFDMSQATEEDGSADAAEDRRLTSRSLGVSKEEDGSPMKDELSGTDGSGIPISGVEPQRVTENDINALFEIAYWFADATTANASVPPGPALPAGMTAGQSAARVMPPSTSLEVKKMNRSSPASTLPLDTPTDRAGTNHSAAAAAGGGSAPLPMYKVLSVEGSQLSSPQNSTALSLTGADDSSLSSLTSRSQQYLPGRVQVYNPVESLVEAVALLEAYRKPQQLRGDRPGRAGRRKRHSVSVDPRARSGGAGAKGSTLPSLTLIPVSDSFTSFISPLVVLTTYLRLHGGTWLKHLCRRVFESLRRPNVLLYVNTLELDAAWASLQPPSSLSSQETTKLSVAAATRGRQRLLNRPIPATPLAPSTAASAEAARSDFLHGLGCLEDLICQDILCALNNFFGFLYGKRAAAARLPQGISILLTQFVSTVHLYMLESVGATRAAAAAAPGNGNRNRSMRPGSHPNPTSSGGATAADAPSRIVEDCLRMCKQRYYAGLRRHGSANESGEAYMSAFRDLDGPLKSVSGGATADATASTASLPRLLHTIEQHRLAKFILFDCWILPALNNAIALGYLASDSPMHLRWNVDALARYLKILVHAPFVEQDKKNFSSLYPEAPRSSRRRSTGHPRSNDVRDGKGGRGADKQPGSGRPPSQGDGRGAGRPTVLTLPPYLTGMYDVATGSLVRLQTSIPMTATAGDNRSKRMSSAAPAAEHATALSAPSSTLSSSAMSTVAHSESVNGEALSPRHTDQCGEDVSALESPTQEGQSKWTLEATALPSSAAAEPQETASRAAPQPHFKVQQAAQHPASAAAANQSTVTPQSASSSRLFSIAGESVEAAADVSSPGTHCDTGSLAGSPKDLQSELPKGSRRKISDTLLCSITPAFTSPHAPPPPLDCIQSIFSSADQRATGVAVAMTHPYVVMDDAVWLDMSPALQNLNDCIGLTFCDRGTGEAFAGDSGTVATISWLPTMNACSGHADSRTGATKARGAAGQRTSGAPKDCSTFVDLALFDVPALEMLNAFAYAACTDDSSHVVVSEFEVLPSMAAGCLERIYELATDMHPMVLHALQKGAFHFAYNDGGRVSSGLTSLYTACMSGVLLHPRTAAHVLKNVMDNNPPFSHTLLKPVADTTALDLLGRLATHSRDVPMVDVNAVVPLIHSMVPDRDSSGGGGRRVHARTDAANSGTVLPAVGAPNTSATSSAAVSHRWERESRRLLRELVFLTTGNSDSGPPLPLAPGLRRPVGPPRPIHMLRAGAARIAEDTGGMTPMVFDPWWRAMVVALCVKVSNVFAECSGNQPVLFQDMCHAQAEESKRLNRYTTAHFVNTKGRETCEKDAVAMMSGSQQRQTSVSGRGSCVGDLPAWPGRKRKRRPKARGVTASAGGRPASTGRKAKKKGRKAAAAAA